MSDALAPDLRATNLDWIKAQARHLDHAKIDAYFKRTGDPIWRPIGHRGYAALRRAIMDGRVLNNDLR